MGTPRSWVGMSTRRREQYRPTVPAKRSDSSRRRFSSTVYRENEFKSDQRLQEREHALPSFIPDWRKRPTVEKSPGVQSPNNHLCLFLDVMCSPPNQALQQWVSHAGHSPPGELHRFLLALSQLELLGHSSTVSCVDAKISELRWIL